MEGCGIKRTGAASPERQNMKKENAVVLELKRIASENGGILKPDVVVAEARPKDSPLHSRFEWDDAKASHEYRIWQARQLIRVSVEVIEGTNEKFDVFVSLTTDREKDGGGYRVVANVLRNKSQREQMLSDALSELKVFQEKYRQLKELAEVFAAARKIKRAA